jgi:hypothetical protein
MITPERRKRSARGDEKLAEAYLESRGFTSIVYEPDGNIPPDFLVEGRIAVEVRRLNRHWVNQTGVAEGVETAQFALVRMLRALFKSLGPPKHGRSWFVNFEFERPLPPIIDLRRAIGRRLIAIRDNELPPTGFTVASQISVDFLPASEVHPLHFVLGGFGDDNTGGFLIPALEGHIKVCLDQKKEKIAPFRTKYREWWLILVDHIGYGAEGTVNVIHDWDRLILLNPLDPRAGIEI